MKKGAKIIRARVSLLGRFICYPNGLRSVLLMIGFTPIVNRPLMILIYKDYPFESMLFCDGSEKVSDLGVSIFSLTF
jgi:hypothetical protein